MSKTVTLQSSTFCKNVLKSYPDYCVFWRSGFEYNSVKERELDRKSDTFDTEIQQCFNLVEATDVKVDEDKKEIHFNGYSCNDLYN